ncbi:Interferon-induced transmembrane protein [Lysobacter silvestris]|uniref:Interferon-induced transmembrane protein n=2 Tax=Solilutibacter silvestris TaxID=1645665 RepID=A0A2K1Q1Z6_9GAMM|nr:CD225/dispanin family protein [Lysobacter silvestris]PNS09049.1 Interferon-induced transmembrane protein [Lysobacter silvestris]
MTNPQNIPNNLVWGILATLFCCLPFGIVSIVYAAKVDGLVSAGDTVGARLASENAKKWAIYAAAASAAIIVLYIIFVFALGGLGALTSHR